MKSRLVAALLLSLVPIASARAIVVYESPGRLTDMPVISGSVKPGWQYIGSSGAFAGIPIGPRAWVTATHVTGTGSTSFGYNNAGTTDSITYFGTRAAVSGDLAVMVLDDGQPDFQEWAPVWSRTDNLYLGQGVVMYGFGLLRGDPVVTTSGTQGWYWGNYDFALSWGTNGLEGLASDGGGNLYFQMRFDQPTGQNHLPGTEGIYSLYDSGGGVFSYNPATSRWELLGINSEVDLVQESSNGAVLYASLFDARGFYDGSTLITGTAPVPLSSYATALPFKYDVLAPYIPVPEPGTLVPLVAGVGLLALRRCRKAA